MRVQQTQPLDVTGARSGPGATSHDPEAERALVERACAGDVRAIDALYELHVQTIYRFVLGRIFGNHADAEDITSAVFEKMVKALPRYEYRGRPFVSWLYQIAVNEANDHGRRKQSRPSSPIMDMDVADPHSGPEGLVEQRLMLGDVYEAMQRLPEAQRRVLELRFGADRSVRETAQILNKSENNVKVLQHKALERLKKLLVGK